MIEVMWQKGKYYPLSNTTNKTDDTEEHKVNQNTLILK